ncbi:MAG: hypothetical protein D6830_07440 [Ignavibacteria bacterium]|nr:MAG: hypothetical protein D6830_07440 [Ignavibacteria bacterium]
MQQHTKLKSVNKVLYVSGYTRMVLFNKLIPKAIRDNHFDVFEFDWNSFYSFNRYLNMFPRSFVVKKINAELLKTAINYKPDYIFVLKGEPILNSTLNKIRDEIDTTIFNWFGDDPWEFPYYSGKIAPNYDFFFTYDPYSVSLYKNSGYSKAFHLPYGYDVDFVDSINVSVKDLKKYKCDIAFIGSYYPEREDVLGKLLNKYDIKIWGRGWEKTSFKNVFMGRALYGKEMFKAMKSCKILINIHKGFGQGVEASGEGLNLRVMEAAAAGCFQLTNYQSDIPNRFIPDEEIVLFRDFEELIEKIEFYLNNDEKRKMIASAARKRVVKDHTLRLRMKQLFEIINKEKNG